MPSFDIVSEIDMPEVRNAVENATRELATRWDFRNVPASFDLNEKDQTVTASSESEFQVQQLIDILRDKLVKRGIDSGALEIPEEMNHSSKTYAITVKLKQGIDKELSKKVIKLIKDSKLKVQAQIQGEQVRVTGKARDDLQQVIALVKSTDLGQPFQFNNFRD